MLTVNFRFCLPRLSVGRVMGGPAVFFIYTGFCEVGIWRGKAVGILYEAIRGIARDPEWLTLNAPAMRHARRRAVAKEQARYRAMREQTLERAYQRIGELEKKLSNEQADNYAMSRVIARLGREDAA